MKAYFTYIRPNVKHILQNIKNFISFISRMGVDDEMAIGPAHS
jgi:hypothetical protein